MELAVGGRLFSWNFITSPPGGTWCVYKLINDDKSHRGDLIEFVRAVDFFIEFHYKSPRWDLMYLKLIYDDKSHRGDLIKFVRAVDFFYEISLQVPPVGLDVFTIYTWPYVDF